MMNLTGYFYTFCLRQAEMRAIENLPTVTKDKITFFVQLSPWLTSKHLSKSFEKVESVLGNQSYFLGIDEHFSAFGDLEAEPRQSLVDFRRIAGSDPDIDFWSNLLIEHPQAHPVLLLNGQNFAGVESQIHFARKQNRRFLLKFSLFEDKPFKPLPVADRVLSYLSDEGLADYQVLFEFGLRENMQVLEAQIDTVLRERNEYLREGVPVVISFTSFPSNFTSINESENLPIPNREMLMRLQRSFNSLSLIHGDWGSTKPRSKAGPRGIPKRRIDYPTPDSWFIVRNQTNNITFEKAAKRLLESNHWDGQLDVWGERIIEDTIGKKEYWIDSMPKMYAARINLHLHLQAHYGGIPRGADLDEVWSDDF